jgi:hypothetical protein
MIGVLCPADEAAAAEEFFQLFKTPWEFHEKGRSYDVVITTVSSVPECDARLRLVFGSVTCSTDADWGVQPGAGQHTAVLEIAEYRVPAYGDVLTFEGTDEGEACVLSERQVAGFSKDFGNGKKGLRLGYDLFKEVQHLLSHGQPLEHSAVPTLDLHIDLVRRWILNAGLPLVEIPPFPAGSSFMVCLTHDIDFIGIRCHRFDHTMWGFLFRATVGAFWRYLRGRLRLECLTQCWAAAASLPLVYLGWLKDFWLPFDWYLEVEKGLGATYYFIPFKSRPGEKVPSRNRERRAAAYDVSDLSDWIPRLQAAGCEIGVHGIDAWHSAEKGEAELLRISVATGEANLGIRMHWLLFNYDTPRLVEDAGYDYDATHGYNETPGYRAGTAQVYKPRGARRLLELPLHIQDGAIFYPQRLNLREPEAWKLCSVFIEHVRIHGGVLTILWHDRSHGPERFWGSFYLRLLGRLKDFDVWFGTAGEVVEWFRARRSVTFERYLDPAGTERLVGRCEGARPVRPLVLRIHRPLREETPVESDATRSDVPWSGEHDVDVSALIHSKPIESPSSAGCPGGTDRQIAREATSQISQSAL